MKNFLYWDGTKWVGGILIGNEWIGGFTRQQLTDLYEKGIINGKTHICNTGPVPQTDIPISKYKTAEQILGKKKTIRYQLGLFDKIIKSSKIIKKVIQWGTILALLILLIILIRAVFSSNETNKEDIKRFVDAANPEFKLVKIEENPNTLFENDSVIASYIISLDKVTQDSVYFFGIYNYVIETGGILSQIPTSKICSRINNLFYYGDTNYVETIRKIKTDISFSLGENATLKVDNLQELLAELFISIKGLININRKKVEILIKGFADGQKNEWERKLLPGKYHYSSVVFFPQLDKESINPTKYLRVNETFNIPEKYSNNHLPNLRARFVKEDFIDPFLICSHKQYKLNFWEKLVAKMRSVFQRDINLQVDSYILQGHTFSKAEQPLNRKVQIYINIY